MAGRKAYTPLAKGALVAAVPTYTVARSCETATAMMLDTPAAVKVCADQAAPTLGAPLRRRRELCAATHTALSDSRSKSIQVLAADVYSGAGRLKSARGLPANRYSAEGPVGFVGPKKNSREPPESLTPCT